MFLINKITLIVSPFEFLDTICEKIDEAFKYTFLIRVFEVLFFDLMINSILCIWTSYQGGTLASVNIILAYLVISISWIAIITPIVLILVFGIKNESEFH